MTAQWLNGEGEGGEDCLPQGFIITRQTVEMIDISTREKATHEFEKNWPSANKKDFRYKNAIKFAAIASEVILLRTPVMPEDYEFVSREDFLAAVNATGTWVDSKTAMTAVRKQLPDGSSRLVNVPVKVVIPDLKKALCYLRDTGKISPKWWQSK